MSLFFFFFLPTLPHDKISTNIHISTKALRRSVNGCLVCVCVFFFFCFLHAHPLRVQIQGAVPKNEDICCGWWYLSLSCRFG